jgi:hypothetical protein
MRPGFPARLSLSASDQERVHELSTQYLGTRARGRRWHAPREADHRSRRTSSAKAILLAERRRLAGRGQAARGIAQVLPQRVVEVLRQLHDQVADIGLTGRCTVATIRSSALHGLIVCGAENTR